MNRFKVDGLWLVFLGLIAALISGCATGPQEPYVPPTITINTIPSGADISIQGNYRGKSPVVIPAPQGYRGNEPIKIEAILEGYETKNVSFGEYHPQTSDLYRNIFDTPVPGYPAKITPAYYTFPNRIDIKLNPLPGHVSTPGASPAPSAVSAPAVQSAPATPAPVNLPAGTYQAKRSYGNGDTYVGEFRAGQLNGKGVYQFANGNRYEGEFRDNHIQGNGVFTCANGKIIPGPFSKIQPLGLVMGCD